MRHVIARAGPHLCQSVKGAVLGHVDDDDPDVRVADEVVQALVQGGLALEDEGGVDGTTVAEVVVRSLDKGAGNSCNRGRRDTFFLKTS